MKIIISFIIQKKFNICITQDFPTISTNFMQKQFKLELVDLKINLEDIELINIKGNITISKLLIYLNNNKIDINIGILDIVIDDLDNLFKYISNLDNNSIDESNSNIKHILFYFYKEIEVHCKSILLKINDKFKFRFDLNQVKINLNSVKIYKIDIFQLLFYFSKNNKLDVNKIIVNNDTILTIHILFGFITFEPIFIFFIKELIDKYLLFFSSKTNKNAITPKKKIYFNLIIDTFNIKLLDIYCTINSLSINKLEKNIVKIYSVLIYNDNEKFININHIYLQDNLFKIERIKLNISYKFILFLESINDFLQYNDNIFDKVSKNKETFIENNYLINNYKNNQNKELSNCRNDFILIEKDTSSVNKIIDYTFKINNIEINLKNKIEIANISIHKVKIILYKDKSKYFRIHDLFIRDLTDKKWDYILYKNSNNHIFELSINLVNHNETNYETFEVYIKPSNITINIDAYCIQLCQPLLTSFFNLIENILSLIPNTPIFIKECILRENIISLSYKPSKLNINKVIKGNSEELINLGTIHDSKMKCIEIRITNIFSFGELFEQLFSRIKDNISENALFIFLQNDKLKYLLFPILRLNNINKLNFNSYLKDISVDLLDIIGSFIHICEKKITNKNDKKNSYSFRKYIFKLQSIVDKEKKNSINKKYKNIKIINE